MNQDKPLALKLADILSKSAESAHYRELRHEAAAELRRLHEENERLLQAIQKLHAAKGRHHTQLTACDLFDLVGLKNERPVK